MKTFFLISFAFIILSFSKAQAQFDENRIAKLTQGVKMVKVLHFPESLRKKYFGKIPDTIDGKKITDQQRAQLADSIIFILLTTPLQPSSTINISIPNQPSLDLSVNSTSKVFLSSVDLNGTFTQLSNEVRSNVTVSDEPETPLNRLKDMAAQLESTKDPDLQKVAIQKLMDSLNYKPFRVSAGATLGSTLGGSTQSNGTAGGFNFQMQGTAVSGMLGDLEYFGKAQFSAESTDTLNAVNISRFILSDGSAFAQVHFTFRHTFFENVSLAAAFGAQLSAFGVRSASDKNTGYQGIGNLNFDLTISHPNFVFTYRAKVMDKPSSFVSLPDNEIPSRVTYFAIAVRKDDGTGLGLKYIFSASDNFKPINNVQIQILTSLDVL
jgi:hypothetical protein